MKTTQKRFYAAVNSYGSETSNGFGNTWDVYIFESKESRDDFIGNSSNISVHAILRKQVACYVQRGDCDVKPFSGDFIGITPASVLEGCGFPKNGFVGTVSVCSQYETHCEHFNK